MRLAFGIGAVLLSAILLAGAAGAHGLSRCRDCCPPPPPPIKVLLKVCHPCTGCKHDVLVCVPACCIDAPCVHFERTIIGSGKTVFEWKSGHRVVVRYHGDGGYRVVNRDS